MEAAGFGLFVLLGLAACSTTRIAHPLPYPPPPKGFVSPTPLPMQENGLWGYVDSSLKFVIPPQFDWAGPFSEGLASVEKGGLFGYIAMDGSIAIQPKYPSAHQFSGGFAWVMTKKPLNLFGTGEAGVLLWARFTFIDHSGREVRPPFMAEHVNGFSESLAAVRPGAFLGGRSQRVGYVDTKGDWAIKPQFDDAKRFSEGLAAVNRGGLHGGGEWGYISKDGQMVIAYKFDDAYPFVNGRACVMQARWLIDSHGRARVMQARKWSLIDSHGNGREVEIKECLHWANETH